MKKLILFFILAKIIYENFGFLGIIFVLICLGVVFYLVASKDKKGMPTQSKKEEEDFPLENSPVDSDKKQKEDFPFEIPEIRGVPPKDDGIYREESTQRKKFLQVAEQISLQKTKQELQTKASLPTSASSNVVSKKASLPLFRENSLQNAVIWAEILAKPVTLRKSFGLRRL